MVAAEQAVRLIREVAELRSVWEARLAKHRGSAGLRDTPRADSAIARLLGRLPEAPIMTARSTERLLGVSFPSARSAFEGRAEAGIMQRRSVERNTTRYVAVEVFELLTHTERRLASTQFDTRVSPPNGPAPEVPERGSA